MGFRDDVEEGLGAVVIFAGSDSDLPHVKEITKGLDRYGIPYEVRIASAHKQQDKVVSLINEYDSIGKPIAYVAVAGGTDALSGMASWHSNSPVISCPPDNPNTSCLTNPSGSSNAYVAKPQNAARFIAQMFSHLDENYRVILKNERDAKVLSLEDIDKGLRENSGGG